MDWAMTPEQDDQPPFGDHGALTPDATRQWVKFKELITDEGIGRADLPKVFISTNYDEAAELARQHFETTLQDLRRLRRRQTFPLGDRSMAERVRVAVFRLSIRTGARRVRREERARKTPRVNPPRWATRILGGRHADHYAREWGAHLWQRVEEGEHGLARRDRRRMAMAAPWLALQLRWAALVGPRSRVRQ